MAEKPDYFREGQRQLLSGQTYHSLKSLAKAIQQNVSEQELISVYENLKKTDAKNELRGYEWIKKLLLIGLTVKISSRYTSGGELLKLLENYVSIPNYKLDSPVVIVAGGTSKKVKAQIGIYREYMLQAFRRFNGTIISGGTSSGVSGLVGELQKVYPAQIKAVGYIPKCKKDLSDNRYGEIRFTNSSEFSAGEPLQYWTDIISSKISPFNVKLIGIGGGNISALEYRLALAFGAKVGILENSGLEADKLLLDKEWNTSKNLVILQSTNSTEAAHFISG